MSAHWKERIEENDLYRFWCDFLLLRLEVAGRGGQEVEGGDPSRVG